MNRSLKCPNCTYIISTFDDSIEKGFCPNCDHLIENVKDEFDKFVSTAQNDEISNYTIEIVKSIHHLWYEKISKVKDLDLKVFRELEVLNQNLLSVAPDLGLAKINKNVLSNLLYIVIDKKIGLEYSEDLDLGLIENIFDYDFRFMKKLLIKWVIVGFTLKMEDSKNFDEAILKRFLKHCEREKLIQIIQEELDLFAEQYSKRNWIMATSRQPEICERMNHFLKFVPRFVAPVNFKYVAKNDFTRGALIQRKDI